MIFLDLLAVLAVVIIIGLYYSYIKRPHQSSVSKVQRNLPETCMLCERSTFQGTDIIYRGAWWHKSCLIKMMY